MPTYSRTQSLKVGSKLGTKESRHTTHTHTHPRRKKKAEDLTNKEEEKSMKSHYEVGSMSYMENGSGNN